MQVTGTVPPPPLEMIYRMKDGVRVIDNAPHMLETHEPEMWVYADENHAWYFHAETHEIRLKEVQR